MNPRSKFPYVCGLIFALIAAAMVFPFAGGAAQGPQTGSQGPAARAPQLPNYDAFGSTNKRAAAAAAAQAAAQGQPQYEGGHMVQVEPRLGVPTFLWAADPGPARSVVQLSTQSGNDASAAAKDHLNRYASRYRLSTDDVGNARVVYVHDTGRGAIIVKLKQDIEGVEVFRDELNVIMNREKQLIALSGYLTGQSDGIAAASQQFNLQPAEAMAKALEDLTGSPVSAGVLHNVQSLTADPNPYQLMTADRGATQSFSFVDDPARIKKVYYHLVDEYVPAYYIEADVYLPSTSGTVLNANTGGYVDEERAYSYVISATDGQVLFRNNLIAEQKVKGGGQESSLGPGGFTYRVWADPVTGIPYDTPAGNGPHPKQPATPDGAQAAFVSPNNVQLPNYPFSQNDPWLAPGSTTTSGNNVEAFANLVNAAGNVDNGFGPAQEPPADPATGDHHAFTSAVDQFIYSHTPDVDAYSVNARQASITQLFYDINFLHDFYYDSGFNEISGNAQTNNFGRGGLQNDNIKGQALDTSSFNNANMLTGADGSRPRMRMYDFINPANMLDVQAPAAIVSKMPIGIAQAGQRNFDVTTNVVVATFSNSPSACTITNAAALAGNIGMFDFDNTDGTGCSFTTRIIKIHATSAVAALMVYTSANANAVANITALVNTITKGVGVISWNNGQLIKAQLTLPTTVTARLLRVADRDGALDNQVVFHEWGHYISNRLIGNGNGLNANQCGGMGEGWGDFNALLALTVREDDTSVPSNANWNGAYAEATYATSGVPFTGTQNNGYYYGIRRYPYSTDMANINPLTFKHITNSQPLPVGPPVGFGASGINNAEVHNTGEVWASMLWECYAALLRDTQGASPRLTFQEAQDRMKNYLVASFKMTPVTPTFTEARDAVLAAAFAYDYNDGRLFAQAFAKRGIGVGAIAPDRWNGSNSGVTESFDAGSSLIYVSTTLDDSTGSCDFDGYLDNGETGLLNVSIKNNGTQNLFATTATVSSSNANVTFPSGATITFPNSQPGQTVTGSVAVTASSMSGVENSDFTITIQDNGAPVTGPVTGHFCDNLNVDEVPASSATDSFDEKANLWTTGVLFNFGAPNMSNAVTGWNLLPATGLAPDHKWFGPDNYYGSDAAITSPVMTVNGGGSLNVQFDHTFGFENDGGGNYDGAVVEVSINGGAYSDVDTSVYNGTILNYSGDVNPLKGRLAFVKQSGGGGSPVQIHSSLTKAIAPGSTVQVRFRNGSDSSVGSFGWYVDNVQFNGVVETPFATLGGESFVCNPAPPVTITLSPSTAPAGNVGDPYNLTITPSGGTGPYTYSTTPVVLPPGLSGSVDGSNNFVISGTPTTVGSYIVTVKANDSASHQGSQNYTIVINKGTPVITWSNPADISYGTALSGTQLNASANVAGAFTYTPPATTVLGAGNAQNLHVDFVPTDTTNYNNTSKNVSINVLKATPSITWNNPADITYGTLLGATQLNASSGVAGNFTYTPPSGTQLNAGNGQNLHVDFVPTDAANYNNASKNVTINVLKATPTITWSNPADISYGTALSATQLNASSGVAGAFFYTPSAGTVLNAGNAQTLSVDLVPTDTTNYNNASKNVSINVLKVDPVITWNNPADITYGTPLSVTQLNASANVAGAFTYTPPAGTLLNAGNSQNLSVNFVPTDSTNYNNKSKNVSINVLKATPVITWNDPADITYPTALSGTQLNATANTPGAFTYTPPATTVLNAGNAQMLSVNFVPTDTANFNNASKNVQINVLKGTPVITWSNPADITYPTALSGTQLNAIANVPGAFTYTPPATTVLNAGNSQNLSVNFVPTDTANYNNASKNVSINVLKGTPVITWNNPADITYPAALGGTQLNAIANVPGAFTYTPPATTVLNAGNGQNLSVNFVPTDTANYNNASKNVSINVLKGTPVITWNNPADITFGTALSGTQLNATANVPGSFSYTPSTGVVLNAGNAQALSTNFIPTDTTNYNNGSKNVSINVLKANQTITFGSLIDKTLGSAPFGVSGTSTSGLGLSFAIQSGPANISGGSTVTVTGLGTVTVRASQPGNSNYNAATPVDQSFNVNKAPTSTGVTSSLNPSMLSQSVTFTATVISAVTPTGTVTFKDGATTLGTGTLNASGVATFATSTLTLGLHAITADYSGDPNCLASSGTLVGGQQVNSPPNGVIQFSAASYSVNEAAGSIAITVTRSGDTTLPASVDYATNDGSTPAVFVPCSTVSGAARDKCDFNRTLGTLQFAAGQSSRTFTILISDDSYLEGIETVQLVLSNPGTGSLLGSQSTAILSIVDNDVAVSGNLIDDASAFVEQLYHDFLNRQSDSAGLAFWTAQITSCGSNQTCIGQARVNVAASFFLSIEFSETGGLVERLYKTAYGSANGTSTFGGAHSLPVPIIRFDEFLVDRQKVGEGVVVGQSGWPALLESNKVAFINEFVARSRFTTAYPAGMSAATFVDTLNTNAGNPLSIAERNQLVSDLGGGIKTRAQVLRAIAEHPNTVSGEFNRAFVLMQYYGFLRRNPNDAPDTDHTGFDFWLTKLNQFNGNYIDAEMVKAFVTSLEFRQRFGN